MSATRIGLLGYGTVGAAVHRLLDGGAAAIERVTGRNLDRAARDAIPAGIRRRPPAS